MATVNNENSGTGVIIGILIAVLLAVGAYFLIKQDKDVDMAATPAAVATPGDINVDAHITPQAPPAPEAPDVNVETPDVDVNVDADDTP